MKMSLEEVTQVISQSDMQARFFRLHIDWKNVIKCGSIFITCTVIYTVCQTHHKSVTKTCVIFMIGRNKMQMQIIYGGFHS